MTRRESRLGDTEAAPNDLADHPKHNGKVVRHHLDTISAEAYNTTPALYVPNIAPDADNLTAALAWAEAGWYVLPVSDPKNPGSVVGKGWQHKSSLDPKVIAAWFAGTGYSIALHCGRSGVVVIDVDHPEKLPEILRRHLDSVPYQSSRPEQPGRGHYIFAMPEGRTIGNRAGKLGKDWGEVRGLNGVIIAYPSEHRDGGEYRLQRTGSMPALPDDIAELIPDVSASNDAATDAVMTAFLAAHQESALTELMRGPVTQFDMKVANGESRHEAAVSVAVWAMDEAAAGCYSAGPAAAAIRKVFIRSLAQRRRPDDRVVNHHLASDEWRGILAWAIGQAGAKSARELKAIRDRAARHLNEDNMLRAAPDPTGSDFVVTLTPASEIDSDVPHWAWEYGDLGRIQLGVLTLFAGRPGAGKSTAARWFAAQFSKGNLGGCWKGRPQKVAYIASEEALDYVVKPGLQVADADMSNIVFPQVTFQGDAVALMSDRDEAKLTELLKAQGVRVIFVDPVMATIRRKVDIYRNNELRHALQPWVRIAQRVNGIVVGVVHLTKGNNGDVVASINGSSGFGEVARCVFGFVKDPQNEGERVMSQVKNSCGPEDLSLAYEIAPTLFTADTGRRGLIPVFNVTGDSDTSVSEIMATAGSTKLRSGMQQVCNLVNSRTETSAEAVFEASLAKSQKSASQMLERLYQRGFIDRPVWGMYSPKVKKIEESLHK
jgi:hypothetical protein